MGQLEDKLAQAVKDGKVPHVVVFATNKDGSFTYKHSVGQHILGDDRPIPEDAEFLLASQTKLLTTISALQLVEKGFFSLDDDVASQLPDLAELPIINGFDDKDEPILENRTKPITLRHLLTHAAGTVYEAMNPHLIKLFQKQGRVSNSGATVEERFLQPSIFEPGTSWMYSPGIDWAGKLVERVTKQTLGEHMKKNIFEPLGISTITFFPYETNNLGSKVPALTARSPDGKLVLYNEPFINTGSKDCFGGHGAYGSMEDYLKVQRSILANDGKILKPETVEMMFTPQLSAESKAGLKAFRESPFGAMAIGEQDPAIEADWGLGGQIFLQDDRGRRKKATLNWGGMANCFWIIDREADLALTVGTQVLPPGDKLVTEVITAVELGVYELAGVKF